MKFLTSLSDAVWGLPTVLLILIAGAAFTLRLKAPQLTRLGGIFKSLSGRGGEGITPFRAAATSLSATVGTGSVIGVATALTLGGAGAIFWLWVSAFFGMAVAYCEGVLSIKYRRTENGERKGGLWYALSDGLGAKKTAKAYALFCVFASFGMGSAVQTNSAASALFDEFSLPKPICGLVLSAVLSLCLMSEKGFAPRLCEVALPLLAGVYVAGALAIIIKNAERLPDVFCDIFSSAFGLRPMVGGAAGYSLKTALSVGFRRGVFSNEAGLGTTASVHASSSVDSPDRQGLMNMFEVVIDTFVICTLTALAILTSGAFPSGLDGAELVIASAEKIFGSASGKLVGVCVAGFAAATAVGWSQIGLSAAEYLFPRRKKPYAAAFVASAFIGTVMSLSAVWKLSDIFNGLMVIPCMSALILLFPEVIKESESSR